MTLSKTVLSAGVVTAVAVGSFAAVGAVGAQTSASTNKEALIERIATDTGSDAATVEASFQAHREERKAQRQEAKEAHLDGLVTEGTLTQEQRDSLEVKFEEMKATKTALKDQDLSREEVRSAMEDARTEFKAWAEDQGIDLDAVKSGRGEGSGRKGRRHHNRGFDTNGTETTSNIEES